MSWAVNAELPGYIREVLPDAAQTKFRLCANEALAKGLKDERLAIRRGWVEVRKGWEKGRGGRWVRKVAPLEKAKPRTLYISRKLLNGEDLVKWAKAQGFKTTTPAEELHVTVAYSKRPVDWMKVAGSNWMGDEKGGVTVKAGGPRLVEPLGDGGAVVLLFACEEFGWRNKFVIDNGGSWDYSGYQPHVTITWDKGDLDLTKVEPYTGELKFGPEIFAEIDESWKDNHLEKLDWGKIAKCFPKEVDATVVKVDPGLGLVFGWAIICKQDGQDYYDLNRDSDGERVPEHIPEHAMLEAASDFMSGPRIHKVMHEGGEEGNVVFAFPLTTDIAKAMGIQTKNTGLMIATKPSTTTLKRYISGELRGFSIGGSRKKVREETV